MTEQSGVFEQDFLIPLVLLSERLNLDDRRVYSVVQNLQHREFRGFTQAVFANSAKLTTHDNTHKFQSNRVSHSVQTPQQGNALRRKQTWRVRSSQCRLQDWRSPHLPVVLSNSWHWAVSWHLALWGSDFYLVYLVPEMDSPWTNHLKMTEMPLYVKTFKLV